MDSPLKSPEPWESLRRQMPVVAQWAYFDHAAVSPLPLPTRDAMTAWASEAAAAGVTAYPAWVQKMGQVRAAAARLINAELAEVALVRSTTEGINLVAEGFPWQPGDNVVTLENEFPSNQYPWLNQVHRGIEVRRVPADGPRVDLGKVRAACDSRTRIVSLSWVGYASGWRSDLAAAAEMAHAAEALLLVDAIQGLGAFPLDLAAVPVDFLAADGHKWLLGPEGAGLFFIRRQHLDLLRPVGVGWHSVANAMDYSHIELKFKPSAARFEGGSCNVAGILGLGASLQLLEGIGAPRIAARVLEITELACERLQNLGARIVSDRQDEHRSGIVLFEMPGQDPVEVRNRCLSRHVALGCRAGRLRISPHAYANADDLDRLLAALEK